MTSSRAAMPMLSRSVDFANGVRRLGKLRELRERVEGLADDKSDEGCDIA